MKDLEDWEIWRFLEQNNFEESGGVFHKGKVTLYIFKEFGGLPRWRFSLSGGDAEADDYTKAREELERFLDWSEDSE